MSTVTAQPVQRARERLPEAWRVEVFRRPDLDDPDGVRALREFAELGARSITSARLGRGFLLSPKLERTSVEALVQELFADPVLDVARVTAPGQAPTIDRAVRHRVLVMRKPGVMDSVAQTIERTIARSTLAKSSDGAPIRALTYQAWELVGEVDPRELERVAKRVFANEVIEDLWIDREDVHFTLPDDHAVRPSVTVVLRDASDDELVRLSRQGCLSLTLLEMQEVRAHYRGLEREPSDCELETIAQTWSEHCKHKTFAGKIDFDGEHIENLFKDTIQRATRELAKPWCISVFKDNAGIVAFERAGETQWDVCFKVETHNHPSAIDPYGGAGTGIGGVIRDVLGVGLGAKPIANTDCFFVGPLDLEDARLPKGCMHPRRILRGVIAGVRDYGNRMGIPTVNGGVWVDPRYVGNPLVYAGTVGLLPRWAAEKSVAPGDVILCVGGRTGRDGIHGATFSSIELDEDSSVVSSSAVQIGDPITEKRVRDGLLRARDLRLYRGITDCGAGGLSSAVGEMSAECGARVHLERVPLKYPGLSPAEIWISEAQERMVLAVPPEHLDAIRAIFAAEDVDATPIGEFTDTKKLELFYGAQRVAELDLHFLHEGTPRPLRIARSTKRVESDPGAPPCANPGAALLALLASPNIASKEWIVRQYDHEVQGTSAIKALVGEREDGPGNGAVLQPLADSRAGVAIGCGANPRYGVLDPWAMASAAIDEALRNVVAVGGDPERTAILDNFSWGNCANPEQLGSLVLAARACYATSVAFGTPFISGKDSLNNEFRVGDEVISIPPTLLVSALAHVHDVAQCVTMDAKSAGNRVAQVGMTHGELGGSHYLAHVGQDGGRVPRPDLALAPKQLVALHRAIRAGLVRSVHDLSEGGLAVAAAEMAFAGRLGLELALSKVPTAELAPTYDANATRLFSESCTRFLVEVEERHVAAFEAAMKERDFAWLGSVTNTGRLIVRGVKGQTVVDLPVEELARAHRGGFAG
ncbi:MAG: phosphoribosylformylglycinamidine synthase subunit PurL [Planctomycetes bacterium]|nr:phosphoribosylformylglycinamidine synthase subunit PurL [Planctomycetota bacterium]